jgi:hypothetical protein
MNNDLLAITKTLKTTNMKLTIFLTSMISLFFVFNKAQAQTNEEILEFFHSGTVTSENKTVKVPIEIWNNLILLKVKINGKKATFLWDNGFSVSAIDNTLVQPYQLLPYGNANHNATLIDGNNVKSSASFLMCPKLEIKGIIISNTPFIKFDSKAVTMTEKLKIDGILGSSVINKLNWRFNFDKNYLEISEKPFAIDETNFILPFEIQDNNTHHVSIAFDTIKTNCIVDFGYNSDVVGINTLGSKYFSKAKATKAFGPGSVSVSGLAPIDTIYTIKNGFTTWELADKELDFLPEISFSRSISNVSVGNKIFRNRYNVTINSIGNTVYELSARTKSYKNTSDKAYGYGMFIIDGKFKIVKIISNANTIINEDIQLMDEVISINGRKPNDFKDNYSLIVYQEKLLRKQKKMVLKFVNGKEVSIIPQLGIEFEFKNEKELWSK